MNIPLRQCIACRKKRPKNQLIRIARDVKGNIVFDPEKQKQGRGFYVCIEKACIRIVKENDLIGNICKIKGTLPLYLKLAEHIQKYETKRIDKILGFAVRSRNLIMGSTAVLREMNKMRVKVILLEKGSSQTTQKRIQKLSKKMKVPIISYDGDKPLQTIVGKPNCRVVGIIKKEFANSLLDLIDK